MNNARRWIAMAACFLLTCAASLASAEDSPRAVAGNLVICGGGDLPGDVHSAFFELAGGKQARIVVIPTASESADEPPSASALEPWQSLGASHVERLHTRDRKVANEEAFVAPLRGATAVWIGGGDQVRLAK